MPISISMIALGSQLVMPVADGLPKFDIARSCKLDVAATTGLSVDQSMKSCVNDEQTARRNAPGTGSNCCPTTPADVPPDGPMGEVTGCSRGAHALSHQAW